MKNTIILFAILISFPVFSQDKYTADTQTLDNTLATLYAVISGEKGEARDWERFKNLFILEARIIPSVTKDGKFSYRIMSPDDYVNIEGKWLEDGFF